MGGVNSDKRNARFECIDFKNLDVIGLAETHLTQGEGVETDNYTWFGHCRKTRHRRAVAASGGVGFLISKLCLDLFDVSVLDSSY